jgi:hypothetical protein
MKQSKYYEYYVDETHIAFDPGGVIAINAELSA